MWCRPKKRRLTVFYGDKGSKIETYSRAKNEILLSVVSVGELDSYRPADHEAYEVKPNSTTTEHGSSSEECSRYRVEKSRRLEDWSQIRDKLVETYFSEEVSSYKCDKCNSSQEEYYRCLDCCQWDNLCFDCITETHLTPHLHKFEIWKGTAFIGEDLPSPVWKNSHECATSYNKTLTIVDEKGRQHNRIIQFCSCEQEAITLIRFHLWPSTIRCPKLAFHFEFMKWLNGLFVEGHMSAKAFCESLKARATKHERHYVTMNVNDIYKALMAETFEEFRMFNYNIEHPLLEDGTSCPACYSSSKKIYSLDADFQLVRKASAGKEWSEPKHAGHFFLKQQEVDEFMNLYSTDRSKPPQDCSDFQAGNNLRSKSKFNKLDETALFGSTCRHGHPKYFFNLKHGERLGYSVYMIKNLLENRSDSGDKMYIMYDIACSLSSHLVKQKETSILNQINLSIPIFHAYGHKVSCQVQYSPRRIEGLGLTDGESTERMWSYLGKFSNITKESVPENRIDTLTNALVHYSLKIQDKLGFILPEKLIKAREIQEKSGTALSELLQPFPSVDETVISNWVLEEKQNNIKTKQDDLTPIQDYVQCLDYLKKNEENSENCHTRKRMMKTIRNFEKDNTIKLTPNSTLFITTLQQVKDMERKEKIDILYNLSSERAFLLNLIKKYARGQSVANRLSKQLKSVNKKLKDCLQTYNHSMDTSVSFDMIKETTSDFWKNSPKIPDKLYYPPLSIRQQAINLKNMIDRSKEEQDMVKEEMISSIEYYKVHHAHFLALFKSINHPNGKKCVAAKEGLYLEKKIADLVEKFQKFIGEKDHPSTFTEILRITHCDLNFFDILESDTEDLSDIEEM